MSDMDVPDTDMFKFFQDFHVFGGFMKDYILVAMSE